MSILCKGITLSGKRCSRKLRNHKYCYQHRNKIFRETKPSDCIICYESLATQQRPLACGHWIHTSCIVESAKAECPVCRAQLQLNKTALKRIQSLAQERNAENLREEEEELQQSLQHQVADLIAPTLRDRINDVVNELLNETSDVGAIDIINSVLDDELYQHFLQYDILENST